MIFFPVNFGEQRNQVSDGGGRWREKVEEQERGLYMAKRSQGGSDDGW
jgi:hypothetical protein